MHIAVIFYRLGPYHHARLQAAARHCALTAIELTEVDKYYAWAPESRQRGYPIEALVEAGSIDDLPLAEARRRMVATLDRVSPDVVAIPGWHNKLALSALQWCRLNDRPAIMMSESTSDDFPRRGPKERLKGRLVRMASAALVGGTPHRNYITQLGMPPESVFLGYDVVDNAYFESRSAIARNMADAERARLTLPASFFLASSRFIEKKNIPTLIEAYDRYRQKAGTGAWHLVVLGDGPMRTQIEDDIRRRKLEEWVSLPGFRQYDELPTYYALAGAFVHASTTEQWGLVVNEAMAAGLPVVVSDRCGCAPDLVAAGVNGFTFPPQDAAALAQRLTEVAAPGFDRQGMGERSQEIVAEWGTERFADGLITAATHALAEPPRRFPLGDRLLLEAMIRWK